MPRPSMEIVVAGVEMTLRLDVTACEYFEDKYGKNIVRAIQDNTGVRQVTLLLTAGVRADTRHRKMTYEKMLSLVKKHLDDGGTLVGLARKCVKSLKEQGILEGEVVTEDDDEGKDQPAS